MSIPDQITYRTIQPGDDEAVRALYEHVQISHAQETGDPAIVDLVRSHVESVFAEDLAEPYLYFTLPGHGCWVAQAGPALVGMACIERWPGDDQTGRLRHVMVNPNWRRQGIASTILDLAESWSERLGYRAVRLITTELNAVAVGIYRRRGYVELERRQGHATVTYMMEKTLRPAGP